MLTHTLAQFPQKMRREGVIALLIFKNIGICKKNYFAFSYFLTRIALTFAVERRIITLSKKASCHSSHLIHYIMRIMSSIAAYSYGHLLSAKRAAGARIAPGTCFSFLRGA